MFVVRCVCCVVRRWLSLFVARCLLRVTCYLLLVVRWLGPFLFGGRCVLFVVCHVLFVLLVLLFVACWYLVLVVGRCSCGCALSFVVACLTLVVVCSLFAFV